VDDGSLIANGQRAFASWVGVMRRFAVLVVMGFALLTAFATWYIAQNLTINTSTTDMISAETPFRRNAIEFDKAFPQFKDLIVIVIDGPSPEAAEIAATRLATALRKKPAIFDRVETPGSEAYFTHNGLLFLSVEALSALADRLAQAEPLLASLARQSDLAGLFEVLTLALRNSAETAEIGALLNRIAEIATAQNAGQSAELSWRELIELGGRRRQIVLAGAALDRSSLAPASAALSEIRNIAGRLGIDGTNGVTMRLTGSVALNHEELQSAALGGKTAGLLSLILVTLLLIIGLRSVWLILPAIISLLAGLVWTAAFAAIAVGHLNLISVAFAVLFVGLGIDFSIHFCLRYREALQQRGGQNDALSLTASQIGGSLAISAACAAFGFLSFLPTDFRGLAELGLISAGGMIIAFFLNLTLLPALLTLFPLPRQRPVRNTSRVFSIHGSRTIVVVAVALGIAGAATAFHVRFDFNPMNLKDPSSESVIALRDLTHEPRNGVYAIDLLAETRDVARAEAARLGNLAAVGDVLTINSLIPKNQTEKLAILEDIGFFLVPALVPGRPEGSGTNVAQSETVSAFRDFLKTYAASNEQSPVAPTAARAAEALATLLLKSQAANPAPELQHRLTTHLPRMLHDLRQALSADFVTIDDLPTHIRRAWVAEDGRFRIQLRPAKPIGGNTDLRNFASAVLTEAPSAVGTPVTITEAGDAVVTAFREATLIAFVLVSIVLLVVLHRISDTLLVLFPLILAAIFTGATAVILGLPFNFANVIVLPLLFGLGVASGIHLVARARRSARTDDMMQTSTPRAVLFSALTTIASFGSLALSGHRGMTSMGQLLTIAIVYTLLCTLVVLPAAMKWLEARAT
jgi:hopanoid biosynthesis associated RND transporter like protein HpnN